METNIAEEPLNMETQNEEQTDQNLYELKNNEILQQKKNSEQFIKNVQHEVQERESLLAELNTKFNELQSQKEHIVCTNKIEVEERTKIIEKINNTHEEVAKFIKIYNAVKSLVQLCITDHEKYENLKQQILNKFTELKNLYETFAEKDALKLQNISKQYKNIIESNNKNREHFNSASKNLKDEISRKQEKLKLSQNKLKDAKDVNFSIYKKCKAFTSERDVIFKDCSELQKKTKQLKSDHENLIQKLSDKINKLNLDSSTNNESNKNLKSKHDDLENAIKNQNGLVEEIEGRIDAIKTVIANYDVTISTLKDKIEKTTENIQLDSNKYIDQINSLDEEFKEMEMENSRLDEENENVEKKIIINENTISDLNSEIEIKTAELSSLENSSSDYQKTLEQIETEFMETLTELKSTLEQKQINNNDDLNKQNELRVELTKINEDLKTANEKYEALVNAASEKEIDLNLDIGALKEQIEGLEEQTKEKQLKLNQVTLEQEERVQQAQAESDRKINSILKHNESYKAEVEALHRREMEKKVDEINKIKEKNTNLELLISQLEAGQKNLDNALELKIKEIESIKKIKELEVSVQKDSVEKEDSPEQFFKPTKMPKKLSTQPNDYTLPNTVVPSSKYSSTSFSDDSSDSSYLATNLKRKRLSKYSETQPNAQVTQTQQSWDEIFDSLRNPNDSNSDSRRKRSSRKPIF